MPDDKAERTFNDACILRCSVETTGFQGGDSGHGGRTTVRLEDLGGCDLSGSVANEMVTIAVGGDAELRVLIQALRFAADSLEALSRN